MILSPRQDSLLERWIGAAQLEAGKQPHRFRPHARAVPGEAHVPVLEFLLKRDGEREAQAPDEILLFVAVEDKRVDDANRFQPGVKVETGRKRQPRPAGLRRIEVALHLHHQPHRARLLQSDGLDPAGEFLLAQHALAFVLRAVFQDQNQLAIFQDLPVSHIHRLDDRRPLSREPAP